MDIPFLRRRPNVAVIRLDGVIAPQPGGFGAPTLSAQRLNPVIERAFKLPRLAGVMLAVNSPGGSAAQSSLIAARIRAMAEEKAVPVVAVVEDAAASGGYWLACAADEIIVDPTSILGSIGVISAGFGFADAIARIGVERRVTTAGTEKSLMDPFRAATPAQQARLEELLATLHEEFKTWVRGRRAGKLKAEEDALFTGRFWTGREAVALGLADGFGTLHGEAKRRFGDKARLVPIGQPRRSLPWRLLGGTGMATEAVEAAFTAAEHRAAWSRIGL
ncbi:S49 family peptidase [Humitalea sp. 24SJ18S-53]|uniref:S49 family peptidase n=1 Tax=Humitalea sp. 24SJ18S-53 TaxID=3422307 RepID=UPI003D678963